MPSDKRVIALRLDDETIARIEKIAEIERRSLANLTEIFVRWSLGRYEKQGRFDFEEQPASKRRQAVRRGSK